MVLVEGSAAKLECRVSAFPDPFIVWSKDGKQLKDGPKYRYVFEDPDFVAIVVRDGVLADLGKYTVTIKNPFGETSGSASILVEGVYLLLALADICSTFRENLRQSPKYFLSQIIWLTDSFHHALTVPAKVSKGPDNNKAKRGTTVVLKAEISGEPPPNVAWLKDGDDIEEDDRWGSLSHC